MDGYSVLILYCMFVIYFIPTIVAIGRKHNSAPAIAVINIFLGWSFLGWVVSLAWSFTGDVKLKRKAVRKIEIEKE